MGRRLGVVLAVVGLAVAAAAVFWFTRDRGGRPARAPPAAMAPRPGVDVARYRASYRRRLDAAREVVARRRAAAARAPRAVDAERAKAAREYLTSGLMEPRCFLGPGELCATLTEPVTDCSEGDARACLAVGQYLADAPPRPLIALAFFHYACKAGDEEGCSRMQDTKEPMTAPCADDPFRCGWTAILSKDPERLDAACTEGVADACATLDRMYAGDVERSRTYLEASCQLGNPMACNELGRRLTAGCKPIPLEDEDLPVSTPCYPPDPAAAAAARELACEAGFEESC